MSSRVCRAVCFVGLRLELAFEGNGRRKFDVVADGVGGASIVLSVLVAERFARMVDLDLCEDLVAIEALKGDGVE